LVGEFREGSVAGYVRALQKEKKKPALYILFFRKKNGEEPKRAM